MSQIPCDIYVKKDLILNKNKVSISWHCHIDIHGHALDTQ